MKYIVNHLKGEVNITKDQQIDLLYNILGTIFDAEDIELFNYGYSCEINIKTHQDIDRNLINILGRLGDDFDVMIRSEFDVMEKMHGVEVPWTKINIQIMPMDHLAEKLDKKEKERIEKQKKNTEDLEKTPESVGDKTRFKVSSIN